jgi:hypothetical protein
MTRLRPIEIDLDIHKLIENERRSFDEPSYLALRRLLKLGAPATSPNPENGRSSRAWSDTGVTLPHGTLLRMRYGRDQLFEGKIVDGRWVIGGRAFSTPSAAASELAVTESGQKTRLNGWTYWAVKRPDDAQWIPLRELRKTTTDDLMKALEV